MFCQKCGMEAESGYRFCQRCGVPLNSSLNKSKTENAVPKVLSQEKFPLWRRLLGGRNPSYLVSVLMIIGGVIVCGIGYSLVDNSTFLQMINMRDFEYARIYGHVGMTQRQWSMAIFGLIINIVGIVSAYIGIVASLDRVKPTNLQNPFIAKLIAIVLCAVVFFMAIVIRILLTDGKGRMSIWDYLILYAIWRAIWRGIVGTKTTNKGCSK